MAQPKTLWDYEENGKYVVIYNQASQRYGIDLWEKLKAKEGYTDDELAEVLNNFKPWKNRTTQDPAKSDTD